MMDKYNHFGVEDLVWDSYFRQWVMAPTRETDRSWNEWLNRNPDASQRLAEARQIVLSLHVPEPHLSQDEVNEAVRQTVNKLNRPAIVRTMDRGRRSTAFHKRVWFRVAASLVVVLLTGWLSRRYLLDSEGRIGSMLTEVVPDYQPRMKERNNTSEESVVVMLDDQSRVVLAPHSRISYSRNFVSEKREVFLSGQAYFEVTKNAESPFFVYANELVTKVLGTSFTVKALEGSREITVEVKTGRVSVFPKSDPKLKQKVDNNELSGLILLPNQKIVFKRDEVRMVKTLVENPEIVLPKEEIPHFVFEDTPVNEVFQSLEKAYGIDILYDSEMLKDCPLTAMLDNQSLSEKLSIICRAVEANYEVLDGQIVIHSNGCRN